MGRVNPSRALALRVAKLEDELQEASRDSRRISPFKANGQLGLPEFSTRYVRGFLSGGSYEAIPLEMNADEIDARFMAGPTKPFSVEAKVQEWIDAGRF